MAVTPIDEAVQQLKSETYRVPEPKFVRRLAPIGCGVGAAVALGTFVLLAIKGDQAGTAAAAATLCLALAVLGALDLESFEGLGIKAKLRTTLSDAEKRLEGIDNIVSTLVSGAYMQIARGNLSAEEQRRMIEDLSSAAHEMGIGKDRLDVLKEPIYEQIALCLWQIPYSLRSRQLTSRRDRLQREAARLASGAEQERIINEIVALNAPIHLSWPANSDFSTFRSRVMALIRDVNWSVPENETVLLQSAAEVADLFEDCLKTSNYTRETVRAIEDSSSFNSEYMQKYTRSLKPE